MHLGHAILLLSIVGGCRCGGDGASTGSASPRRDAAAPPATPAHGPLDLVQSLAVVGCLLDQGRSPREVMKIIAEDSSPAVVRIAGDVAVERARADGESPTANVLADLIDVATELDDVGLLKAAFTQLEALTVQLSLRHHGPQRARAGLPLAAGDIAGDYLAIAREQAIAGDIAGATKFLDANTKKIDWNAAYAYDEQVGAFVAIGRLAEARRVIVAAKEEDRLKLAGVWLDTALRMNAPLAGALAAVDAELKVAPERGLMWFGDRDLFRRARRLGRGKELAPLAQALLARYAGMSKQPGGLPDLRYDLTFAVGDPAAIQAIAADPALASKIAIRTGPLAQALAAAAAEKYPLDQMVRIWARAVQAAPPGFGEALIAATCTKQPAARVTPTPSRAGAKLAVIEKARGNRQECELHDVNVRLTEGTELLDEDTLEGECHGACTATEKREGRAEYQRILKEIERGEASESQTDYNFTDCMFVGPDPGRIDHVDGRDVALIVEHSIGPHDVPKTSYVLALEVCGELHVSGGFGGMYAGNWALSELTVRMTPDKTQLVVDGASDRWRGVVFRLTLPQCPSKPLEQAIDTQ